MNNPHDCDDWRDGECSVCERDRLTPERTIRLLRAKANELESYGLSRNTVASWDLATDIALIAAHLADHIERTIADE